MANHQELSHATQMKGRNTRMSMCYIHPAVPSAYAAQQIESSANVLCLFMEHCDFLFQPREQTNRCSIFSSGFRCGVISATSSCLDGHFRKLHNHSLVRGPLTQFSIKQHFNQFYEIMILNAPRSLRVQENQSRCALTSIGTISVSTFKTASTVYSKVIDRILSVQNFV